MADYSDVAMEPHHVIRDRISATEAEGTVPTYEAVDDTYAGAPASPLPQGGN